MRSLGQEEHIVALISALYSLSYFLYNTTSRELLAVSSIAYGVALALSFVTGGTFLVENSTAYERMHLFQCITLSIRSRYCLGIWLVASSLACWLACYRLSQGVPLSYRLTLYVSLAATILSLLPLSYIKEKSSTKNANISHLKVYRSIFQSKTACQMIFIYCLYGIGWGVSLPYFNVYFDTILGANTSQIGIIFSVSQLTMVIGYFLVPLLTDEVGEESGWHPWYRFYPYHFF